MNDFTSAAQLADTTQKSNGRGSWEDNDPDRPKWSKSTKRTNIFEYQRADGSYAFEIWKGINPDGEKVRTTRRRNMLSFSDRLEPEDKKDWHYGLGDEPKVLFKLPELIAATKEAGTLVMLAEGEPDALVAIELGFVATTNPFGALAWREEYSPFLDKCDVVLLQDNDDKGLLRVARVSRSLASHAPRIRILAMPDGHKDLRDWVEAQRNAGKNKEAIATELRTLIDAAPEPEAEELGGLDIWNAGSDTGPISPRGWLLANVFCRSFASSLIGDGGTGKTALRIAQALSLATGKSLTGEYVFQRCRVLIVSLEDGRDELRRRVRAAMMHYQISPEEVDGWLFLSAPGREVGKLLTTNAKGGTADGGLAAKLRAEIRKWHIDLVILDPFVKTHSVEENNNSGMDEVVQILANLATEEDIAVDFPHHTSKGRAATPGDADRGRGATAVKDGARLVYTLTTMTTDEAEAFGIAEGERRLFFRIDPGKVNITPPARDAAWFKLVGVRLGNRSELYPSGDEVQAVERWTPPEAFIGLTDDLINRILDQIAEGLDDGNYYTNAPNVKDRAAWEVVQEHAPEKTNKQCREIIKTWVKTGVLVTDDYQNPKTRKKVKGLKVDDTKRPGVM